MMYFEEALHFAQKEGNKWRLPSIKELDSITEQDCSPIINTRIFDDMKNFHKFAPFWSSTFLAEMPNYVYYVDYIQKQLDIHSKGYSMFVRLVKSKKDD